MSFVNECVPDDDVKKYGLEEINLAYRKVEARYRWTVDRDRDIYLRWMRTDRDTFQQSFSFYWQGYLIPVGVTIDVLGGRRVYALNYLTLPKDLRPSQAEIVEDLKCGLSVFSGSVGDPALVNDFRF